MNQENVISFLSGFGEEFCQTLHPMVGWDANVPPDAYEIFYSTFNQEPSPQRLAALSESQLKQWCTSCREYFECQGILSLTFNQSCQPRSPIGPLALPRTSAVTPSRLLRLTAPVWRSMILQRCNQHLSILENETTSSRVETFSSAHII